MPEVVVETKLLVPRLRQRTVPRPRLEDLLDGGADARLTLVAAPAGFGKTTLLAGWLDKRGGGCPVAWLALDERDSDPAVFWTHLLHAVERAVPGAATPALGQLRSGTGHEDVVLSLLVNELGVGAADLTVVLDDYHLAESPAVQPGMAFLLDRLPPHVHLVISTRSDPALPLARLRARGELVEIRAAELRFHGDEADTYLNEVHALALDDADVATLEARTEGWAAVLQLAALSLQGKEDPSGFISGFAGDDRFVVDYLADEVLDRQPPDVRDFLLETSVLHELSGPLCDAVTRRTDSQGELEQLERRNLFLVPLDGRRVKYRYHHLFADVLRARLLAERPDDAPTLHRRASDWYQQAGEPEAAVHHAVAAGDLDLAADRIELAAPVLLRHRREAVLRRWAHELPAEIVRDRPVLAVAFIGGLMSSNDFDDVAARLAYADRLLATPVEELVVVDEAGLARLPAEVQTYHAALSLVRQQPALTVQHAEAALALAAEDDHLSIAAASALLGLTSWAAGDLDAAHRGYRTAADHLERAGHVADVLGCSITLADLEMTRGRLLEARGTFEHALSLTGGTLMRGVADMHVGLSCVAWQQGDLTAAADHLRKADDVGDAYGLPQNPYRWRVMMARLRHAGGDTASAVELLDDAERVYVGDFSPNVRPVAAFRARLLAAAGDLDGARRWVRDRGLAAADERTYLSEYERLTLARVMIAEHALSPTQDHLDRAEALLADLVDDARHGGRTGTVIEALVAEALVRHVADDVASATEALARALRLAEPEGLVAVFADEGRPMSELLHRLARRDPDDPFVPLLLRVIAGRRAGTGDVVGRSTRSAAVPPGDRLIDPLSDREVDVLRLLASDLGGPDIARELHVSLATVRTHTQHIYAKLGVNNRRAAVRRAHQLDLFPRAGR